MKLVKGSTEKKTINTIYFKSSVTEIADTQKVQAIKTILNTVDLLPDVSDESRKRLRKAVLDSINDIHRVFINIIESLIEKR